MQSAQLMIVHGHIITQNENEDEIIDGAVVVSGNDILAIGPTEEIKQSYQAERTIDASQRFVFPGFVNTHTHLFQTFLKGLGEGVFVHEWLDTITRPAVNNMSVKDFYLSAKAGCLDAIRSGTTTLLEYMYPNPRYEMGDAILDGIVDSGIRALLGRGLADIGANEGYILREAFYSELVESVPASLKDAERLIKLCNSKGQGRIDLCLAPTFMRCMTNESFGLMKEFAHANSCLISMHNLENPRDDEVSLEKHGMPAVEWLEKIGFLGPDFHAVHCVQLSEDGIERFAAHDVKVSYNPVSHMYIGLGVAPVTTMLKHDLVVGIGTDGAASNNAQDMIEVMKAGVLLQRVFERNPAALSGRDALRMATIEGARSIGMEDRIGSLEPGKRADIVIANFNHLKSGPYYDPINTMVFSSDPRVIESVVIDGDVVLDHGKFTALDEEAFVDEIVDAGHRLAKATFSAEALKFATALD
jgi:5-methylthioadenosine/S-adenosylhomocysteine deaminase